MLEFSTLEHYNFFGNRVVAKVQLTLKTCKSSDQPTVEKSNIILTALNLTTDSLLLLSVR